MIDIKIKDSRTVIKANGSLADITAELHWAIKEIADSLSVEDKEPFIKTFKDANSPLYLLLGGRTVNTTDGWSKLIADLMNL